MGNTCDECGKETTTFYPRMAGMRGIGGPLRVLLFGSDEWQRHEAACVDEHGNRLPPVTFLRVCKECIDKR